MSLVDEKWELVARGVDDDGNEVCYVARRKHDIEARLTVWKLVKIGYRWRSVGQWISKGRFRTFPEHNGVRLRHNRIDRILLGIAEDKSIPAANDLPSFEADPSTYWKELA